MSQKKVPCPGTDKGPCPVKAMMWPKTKQCRRCRRDSKPPAPPPKPCDGVKGQPCPDGRMVPAGQARCGHCYRLHNKRTANPYAQPTRKQRKARRLELIRHRHRMLQRQERVVLR